MCRKVKQVALLSQTALVIYLFTASILWLLHNGGTVCSCGCEAK